jgi:Family of unknown function (DUF6064)
MARMPFTETQFFDIFAAFNEAIWPAQPVAYLLGLAVLVAIAFGDTLGPRLAFGTLAAAWLTMGAVYHIGYFAEINPLARTFGIVFIAQAVWLAVNAIGRDPPRFAYRRDFATAGAIALIVYAVAVYPLLSWVARHGGMRGPMFGVAPCPTTIFTFAMLMLVRPIGWSLLVIPTLWAMIGTTAAIGLGVPEDFGMPVAAAAAWVAWYLPRRALA